MIREFCAENHERLARALAAGAQRIELCDNLAVGGTTPSYGVIAHVCQKAHEQGARVMTMIRPRGGSFCYTAEELEMMVTDCQVARSLGSDGLVFGSLTADGWLDEPAMERLIAAAGDCETVCHMAFDQIPQERQKEALDWLAGKGVTRVLTRGGKQGAALDHLDWLSHLLTHAAGRIELVVGGGVTKDNLETLLDHLPLDQVHGTRLFW